MDPYDSEYRGRRIELGPADARDAGEPTAGPVLRIDGEPIPYGQLPDGLYFLRQYAYDWHENLIDLARSFIDYEIKLADIRERRHGGGN